MVVKPTQNQVDDFIEEVQKVIERGERALVTVLTKKAAEMFSAYLNELGIRAEYLHSELDTVERVEVLKKLREGSVDVVVGVNLLREGLDLPEVSLVAIMDADKEGFLRSETTLIQTIGRAARNINGKVLLYADRITNSMKRAIEETNRRRMKQLMYNIEHDIKPESIVKPLYENIFEEFADNEEKIEIAKNTYLDGILALKEDLEAEEYLALLEEEMWRASSDYVMRMQRCYVTRCSESSEKQRKTTFKGLII